MVETQQPAADPSADYQQQVELLKAKNAELIGERRKDKERFDLMERQLQEIQERSNKQRQAKLAESGEHKKLWEEAQKTVAEREAELNELRTEMAKQAAKAESQQIQSVATSAMAQMGVFAPDQLYQLMSQKLKFNGDEVKAIGWGRRGVIGRIHRKPEEPWVWLRALLLRQPRLRNGNLPWFTITYGGNGQPLYLS